MYISKVLSNLGAWNTFQDNYPAIYNELCNIVNIIEPQRTKTNHEKVRRDELLISAQNLVRQFINQLVKNGWRDCRITFGGDSSSGFSEIDSVKEKIGLEISLGKFAFAESDIFVKFPIFVRAEIINFAILLLPTRLLVREMSSGIGDFEMVQRRLKEISPLLPKYPFLILGISHKPSNLEIQELTSPLDSFLIEALGYSFLEMKIQSERPNYDFKVKLPSESHKLAKEFCALANQKKGGVILVGVEDNGNLCGIPRNELDEAQRRVIDIGTKACKPSPKLECIPFDIPSNPEKCVLAIRLSEIEQKPCMTNEKVYIRAGTMARAANTEEIRRLLLGSAS